MYTPPTTMKSYVFPTLPILLLVCNLVRDDATRLRIAIDTEKSYKKQQGSEQEASNPAFTPSIGEQGCLVDNNRMWGKKLPRIVDLVCAHNSLCQIPMTLAFGGVKRDQRWTLSSASNKQDLQKVCGIVPSAKSFQRGGRPARRTTFVDFGISNGSWWLCAYSTSKAPVMRLIFLLT